MPDKKISELTELPQAEVADDDEFAIVDKSATETKKFTWSSIKGALQNFFSNIFASNFLDLSDTPSSYTGQAGKVAKVKSTEDGLEFGEAGVGAFLDLSDTPSSYSGQGGKVVKVKSAEDGLEFADPSEPLTIFVPAGEFHTSDGVIIIRTNGYAPAGRFDDGKVEHGALSVRVPKGATSISSIKVLYDNAVASADLYLRFYTGKLREGEAYVTDTGDTYSAYTTPAETGRMQAITVPSACYDGLGTLAEGDIVTINIFRDATNAADTWNRFWDVIGVLFTFA